MVDAADSKSVACKGVLVQVRPGAPNRVSFIDGRIDRKESADFIGRVRGFISLFAAGCRWASGPDRAIDGACALCGGRRSAVAASVSHKVDDRLSCFRGDSRWSAFARRRRHLYSAFAEPASEQARHAARRPAHSRSRGQGIDCEVRERRRDHAGGKNRRDGR